MYCAWARQGLANLCVCVLVQKKSVTGLEFDLSLHFVSVHCEKICFEFLMEMA